MAITTLDGVLAGMQRPRPYFKTGNTMPAVGAQRAYTPWYVGGSPGAGVASVVGVNGETQVGNAVAGQLPRTNSAALSYLARFNGFASQIGNLWLLDRLWQNSGLSPTLTTLQSITPVAIPARDNAGTTNGDGVFCGIEWSATGGAGTPTCTLTYTNQAGTAGRTATLTGLTAPVTGTVELFGLQAGDTGIRSIQGFQMNATRTSGTFHLVLFRLLASLEIPTANAGNSIDALTGGFPQIYDNTVPQLLFWNSATGAATISGSYTESHG